MTRRVIHWPSLTAEEAQAEWDELRLWVARLCARYPTTVRVPDCWWRHNDIVELLTALRDHERGCFSDDAVLTAPLDWQRALREVEQRLELWTKRMPCAVPGRGHAPPVPDEARPAGWDDFVAADVERRRVDETPPTSL